MMSVVPRDLLEERSTRSTCEAGLFVQVPRWLISQHQGWLIDQRTGDCHPLLLAAGQRPVDGAPQPVAQSDLGEDAGAAPAGRGTADPVELEGEAHILLDVERGYEIEELVYEPEVRARRKSAALRSSCIEVTIRPPIATSPLSARSIPLTIFSRVDLPEPLRPTIATTSPAPMLASTWSSTRCTPVPSLKLRQSWRMTIKG